MSVEITATLNLKSDRKVDTNAEEFYRNFWVESGNLSETSINLKLMIMQRFGLDGIAGKKILEIGVGGEGGLIVLLQQHNEVFGVDVSDAALRNCTNFGVPAMKANMDRERLPFDDGYFDYIIAFEVFEHFSNPQFALEELKRLLKPGGTLLISTPSPLTYHWPRLFYPELFEEAAFSDFLMINGFAVDKIDNWFVKSLFKKIPMPEDQKVWGWYWNCRKLGSNDATELFENGKYFWEKRNKYGMRLRPLEALEIFRKCYEIDPAYYQYKLYFTHALLYRGLNGDAGDFFKLLTEIYESFDTVPEEQQNDFVATFCKIVLEACKFDHKLVDDESIQRVVSKARHFPELQNYLAEAGFF